MSTDTGQMAASSGLFVRRVGCPAYPEVLMDQLIKQAREKFQSEDCRGDLAAVLGPVAREPDEDGQRWRLAIANEDQEMLVEATLSDSSAARVDRPITRALVEAAVERRAVTLFQVESRMDDLAASGPIPLRAEHLHPHPEPSAFT